MEARAAMLLHRHHGQAGRLGALCFALHIIIGPLGDHAFVIGNPSPTSPPLR